MICYKGIIVCLLQISIINRPSKGYVMHFCQGMYVYMPKKKRRRVLLHLMPMNSKCIAPAITHSQRTDLIAVHLILALCEFHYCEFHYCNFSKLSQYLANEIFRPKYFITAIFMIGLKVR